PPMHRVVKPLRRAVLQWLSVLAKSRRSAEPAPYSTSRCCGSPVSSRGWGGHRRGPCSRRRLLAAGAEEVMRRICKARAVSSREGPGRGSRARRCRLLGRIQLQSPDRVAEFGLGHDQAKVVVQEGPTPQEIIVRTVSWRVDQRNTARPQGVGILRKCGLGSGGSKNQQASRSRDIPRFHRYALYPKR